MKRTTFLSIGLFLLLVSFTSHQQGIGDVINSINSGNSSALAKYFDSYVDIAMPDKSNNYSKTQAELIIKDFFSNNGVQKFEVKHKGNNDKGEFCIGTLQTRNGSFRVNVFMRAKGEKLFVQEIRIQSL